jgi:succinate dehydrogenase/fumarate reductase flavoprotein subunit
MLQRITGALMVVFGLIAVANAAPPDQPFMEAARADLIKAKSELQLATRDKGGHRAKAVGLVNQAIGQVNAGIQYARRHNHAASPDQPHMQAALDALESARNNLDKANADKGGHRANAIQLVKDAISEVKLGIEAAR